MSKFTSFRTSSSASQSDSDVIDQQGNKSILIRSLNATGGDVLDTVRAFPAGLKGKTTVKNAVTANADAAILVGDSGAGNQLNSNAINAADFVIMHLDTGGWQLMEITTVNGGAANGEIDITGFTPFDAADEPSAAVAAGSTCYVILAEDVESIFLGTSSLNLDLPFIGNPGAPLALSNDGNDTVSHFMSGVAEYVEGAITRI